MKVPLDYEIRVSGPVPESLLVETEGLKVVREPVQTVLRGPVPDQAALHGIINRLQRLGLELIEVRRVGPHATDADADDCPIADAHARTETRAHPTETQTPQARPTQSQTPRSQPPPSDPTP